jgi:threonylcarbamoyladenosine tRNA methylthiotransferase MtaB
LPETYTSLFDTDNTEKILVNDIMSVRETAGHLMSAYDNRSRAYLQIQNGCNHRCTFCIIPFGRGNSRSVPAGVVVDQVKQAVQKGYNEIVLTGVDITSWGGDMPSTPHLGYLVDKILTLVPDLPRLRLSSIDSIETDERLMDIIQSEKRFMPHLHLSLQAGDDMILKRMKRRHNTQDALDFCDAVRKYRPDIAFGADIIAGFPTETDEMFDNTAAFLKKINVVYAHIFPFSPRTGTPAAKMPQVEKSVIKRRAAVLRKIGNDNHTAFMESLVGTQQNIIVEQNNFARTENFAHVKLNFDADAGTLRKVKISAIRDNILYADGL